MAKVIIDYEGPTSSESNHPRRAKIAVVTGWISIMAPILFVLAIPISLTMAQTEQQSYAAINLVTILFFSLCSIGLISGIVVIILYRGSTLPWIGVILNLMVIAAAFVLKSLLSY
jgi:hypothetical protein